jgi:hypothetical protein
LARAAVKRFRGRRNLVKRPRTYLRVYRCDLCRHWHVGSSNKAVDGRRNPFKKCFSRYEPDGVRESRWENNLRLVTALLNGERLQNLQEPAEAGD